MFIYIYIYIYIYIHVYIYMGGVRGKGCLREDELFKYTVFIVKMHGDILKWTVYKTINVQIDSSNP